MRESKFCKQTHSALTWLFGVSAVLTALTVSRVYLSRALFPIDLSSWQDLMRANLLPLAHTTPDELALQFATSRGIVRGAVSMFEEVAGMQTPKEHSAREREARRSVLAIKQQK